MYNPDKKIDFINPRSELAKHTRYNLTTIESMLDAQKKLDEIALQNAGVTDSEVADNMLIGLFVEAGEAMNEIEKHWKHWKKKHRNDPEKIMDELADVLHLILSRGVALNVDPLHRHIITHQNIVIQLKKLARSIPFCDEGHFHWWETFALFRGLIEMLGVDWDDMKSEYWAKHEINRRRQENGY